MSSNTKIVLSFFVYMFNKWSLDECMSVFDGDIDNTYCLAWHLWNKWETYHGDVSTFVGCLDEGNLERLVQRACSLYDGREPR